MAEVEVVADKTLACAETHDMHGRFDIFVRENLSINSYTFLTTGFSYRKPTEISTPYPSNE